MQRDTKDHELKDVKIKFSHPENDCGRLWHSTTLHLRC